LASKISRSTLIAIAIGAGGLVAVPAAEAAVSVPTYLVNQPAISGANQITPESAVVSGAIDTGGNPGSTFQLAPGGTLSWANGVVLGNTGTTASTQWVDGIPTNASTGNFAVAGGILNNGGTDNYSSVVFEYDPVSDYNASGGTPGPQTSFAPEVDVPTAAGLSTVSTKIGAYPASTGDTTGQSPLLPGTAYYYWIVQQSGVTSAAEDVNTFNPNSSTAATSVNPSYTCYPDSYIAATPPYSGYTTTGTLSGGVTSAGGPAQTTPQPQIQGPCLFYFGSSNNYYQSPNGMFTTPKLGTVSFGAKATLSGKNAVLTVSNKSVMPAKGVVTLSIGGASVGTGHFSVAANGSGTVKVLLNGKGVSAAGKNTTAKVAAVVSTDQLVGTKSTKL
jgi:hypothetical protein